MQENVTAVLTASTTDVLSHVAIRARSQHVLLATCFDEAELESLRDLDGSTVALTVDATGSVSSTPMNDKVCLKKKLDQRLQPRHGWELYSRPSANMMQHLLRTMNIPQ